MAAQKAKAVKLARNRITQNVMKGESQDASARLEEANAVAIDRPEPSCPVLSTSDGANPNYAAEGTSNHSATGQRDSVGGGSTIAEKGHADDQIPGNDDIVTGDVDSECHETGDESKRTAVHLPPEEAARPNERGKILRLPTTQLVNCGDITDWVTPDETEIVTVVPLGGMYSVVGNWDIVEQQIAAGEEAIDCVTAPAGEDGDAAPAIKKVGIRHQSLSGRVSYAESARSIKQLRDFLLTRPDRFVAHKHGGNRTQEGDTARRNVNEVIAEAIGCDHDTASMYIRHAEDLSDTTLDALATKRVPKTFFQTVQPMKRSLINRLKKADTAPDEVQAEVNARMLAWLDEYIRDGKVVDDSPRPTPRVQPAASDDTNPPGDEYCGEDETDDVETDEEETDEDEYDEDEYDEDESDEEGTDDGSSGAISVVCDEIKTAEEWHELMIEFSQRYDEIGSNVSYIVECGTHWDRVVPQLDDLRLLVDGIHEEIQLLTKVAHHFAAVELKSARSADGAKEVTLQTSVAA